MSQQKVDRRKVEKKNRKQTIAKEKRLHSLNKFIAYLCLLAVIVGIGFSVYQKVTPEPVSDPTAFYSLIGTDNYGILSPYLASSAE